MEAELLVTILKIAGVFVGLSFIVFWVGGVWWVSQDVVSRTNDKIILAAAVAFATIFGPVGVLFYLIVRPRQTIRESYREMLETEINRKLASLDMAYCPFCGANLEHDVAFEHPDQLTISEVNQEIAAMEPVKKAELIEQSSLEGDGAGQDKKQLLSVRVTKKVVDLGRGAVGGLTFLLTPLPAKPSTVPNKTAEKIDMGLKAEEVADSTQAIEFEEPRAKESDVADKKPAAKKATPAKKVTRTTKTTKSGAGRRGKK